MILKARETMSNVDVFNNNINNKTSKLVNRKVWPLAEPKLQEDWTRDPCIQQMLKRPGQPRPQNMLRNEPSPDLQVMAEQNDREKFHNAIGPILTMAQFFGILPVAGVRTSSPKDLSFKFFSLRTVYTITIIAMLFTMASISVIHMVHSLKAHTFGIHGAIAASTAGAVFYSNSLLGMVLFAWLAPRWIPLQRTWRAMERIVDRDKHQPPRLRWKFSILTGTIMLCALAEHLLSIVNNSPPDFWSSASNYTFGDYLRLYSERSHAFVFTICDYNLAMGIFIFCVSKLATFSWNFTDVFVILVSTGLAERYKSLNQRVIINVSNYRRNVDWCELRESYAALSSLVKNVDDNISPIMLLSFANNLYFICLQLLNGLSPSESTLLTDVYFFGSFAFLLGRTITVTLMTARINDQSKVALPAVYSCPTAAYNVETQRLQHQLTTDDICLTGMRFFCITRNFMLAVAGAILTYEVVLLQFNVAMNK